MKITSRRNGRVLAERVEVARSLTSRLIGLIGRRSFPQGSAFVIPGCKQVHTFLMRFPIDVIYSDADDKVVCAAERVKPFRLTSYCRTATQAIELPAGTISAAGIQPDDLLVFSD